MNWYSKLFLLVKFIFLWGMFYNNFLFSQTREELGMKKKENMEQLEYSRSILKKMTKTKSTSMNQINIIEKNIELRQDLVENISNEIEYINSDIELNNNEIIKINNRVELLKKEYAALIRNSYKVLDKEYALLYILSAEDINQGYMRMKYLKYLTDYRKNLISELDSQKIYLRNMNETLINNKIINEKLLNEKLRELKNLDNDKKEKVILVNNLQLKEAELKREINKREKIMMQIENEIKRIIEEEARKARESRKINNLSDEERLISADFSKNQGKLPWPTDKGIVTGKFGEQNHAVLKGIKVKSNGIDIATDKGANVKSIFDGEVTRVIAIKGANYTVIIKHADYFTVYQNLVDVKVKAGDKVETGDVIGTVFTDTENVSKVHFEVWKDKNILNPERWLK